MRKVDEAYEYIKSYIKKRGYPPTIREIGDAINISSTSTISYYLRKLEESNKIVKSDYKNRSIQLVDNIEEHISSDSVIALPHICNLTNGKPLMFEPNISQRYVFSGSMFKGFNMFLMSVKDNSMIDSSILKDDLVVVSRQNVAKNGEIVVALVDGDYVIARLYQEFGVLKLHNGKQRDPIYARKVVILGKVVGVIRNQIT